MAIELRGKAVADSMTLENQDLLKALKKNVKLSIVRLGSNPDDISYERSIIRYADKIGLGTDAYNLALESRTEEVIELLDELNKDNTIGGIILLRPLPEHIDYDLVSRSIAPKKDIDAMNPLSLLHIFQGEKGAFFPSTARAVINLLDYYKIDLKSKRICIINRSPVVGKPLAMMLLDRDSTVTICHSKTENLKDICQSSDIVISALGRAKFLGREYFNDRSIVIDVGMSLDEDSKLSGDVNYDEVKDLVAMISPVPGGVGRVTTATLFNQMLKNI